MLKFAKTNALKMRVQACFKHITVSWPYEICYV